ncbi:hypothetical protein [uncultured Enterovirga sp.]|uniref:hypothetical protein n=1 Tax=uncultured Enterovirga sp. TaxID=2026352 RepID=UPI0035C9FBF5
MPDDDVLPEDGLGEQPHSEPHLPDRRAVARRRLSIDISPDLHRRIVTICATRRVPVNQAVREVLERAFPA